MTQDMKKDTILHKIGQLIIPLKRTMSPLEADSHSACCGHFFNRSLLLILLMLILGVGSTWGQPETGYYRLKSCKKGGGKDYYMCPAAENNQFLVEGQPFLTTHQLVSDNPSFIWLVQKFDDDYYYIIHHEGDKDMYITTNDAPSSNTTGDHRRRLHLEEIGTPGGDQYLFKIGYEYDGGADSKYNIWNKELTVKIGNDVHKYLSISGNHNDSYGSLNDDRGMIGLYSKSNDTGVQWQFEPYDKCLPPVITCEDGTVSIECATEGRTIYYTTTGDDPDPTDETQRYNTPFPVTSETTVKAIAVKTNFDNSKIVSKTFIQAEVPAITFDQATQKVIVSPVTTGVDYYYITASGTDAPADPTRATGTPYDSGSGITLSDNSITTIKVIAFEDDKIPSDAVNKTIVYMPTITLTGGPYTYDGMPKTPSINSVAVGGTSVSGYGTPTYENNTNAGTTAKVTIREDETSDYFIYGTVEFTINKTPLTVTAKNHTITYGDAPVGNGVEYSGFVNGETQSVLGGQIGYTSSYTQYGDVGDYTITPSGLSSTNYEFDYKNGTLTVTQKEVGLSWETELTYIGVSQVPTVTAAGTVNGDEIGVTVTGGQTAVGSGYIATASALTGAQAGNYKLPAANTIEFSIGKAPLTVTANNYSIPYGDAPANGGVSYSGFVVPSDDASVLSGTVFYGYNYTQFGDVGDYIITPMGLTATNYEITFEPGTLTVTPKEVGLTWGETDLTYSGSEQAPTATATGTVNGDEIGVIVEGEINVGDGYTATASALTGEKAGNYKLPDAKTTEFSIGKASLTVTANDLTITYGDNPADAEAGVTYTGFVNNESESDLTGTLGYAYNYSVFGDVGTYANAITPSGLTSDKYAITYENGTLTVTPKEVRITWGETDLTYNGSEQAPTATITSRDDIVNNDEVSDVVKVTPSAKEGSALTDEKAINPGYYRATASFTGAKAGNYKPAPFSKSFKISGKTIGDGNEPAEGINISLTQEGSDVEVTVTDGGTPLVLNEDYTVETTEPQGFDTYITITGKGHYGGCVRKLFVKPEFFKPTGASEYAAVYRASSDLSNPTGITPYIVKKVNPSLGTINIAPVDYLPKDVPVLMLASTNIQGFLASPKPDDEEAEDYIPVITAETENSNVLKVAPESGVAVEAAQVYMFYKGEFVLTKKGTITNGKFYLYNPNYKAIPNSDEEEGGGGAGARSILRFVVGDETDIVDVEKSEDSRTASGNDSWYLLDGRRLSGKPTKQGLYIWNGRKTVIKKK